MKPHHVPAVSGLTHAGLRAWTEEQGIPAYRADQIFRWVQHAGVTSYSEMSNLPAELRNALPGRMPIHSSTVVTEGDAKDETGKVLIRLADGNLVESVMIPEGERRTICVSTQVGCPVGCDFCASGKAGFLRNLQPWEIVEQVLHLRRRMPESERVTNIVFMGIGEPLLNWSAIQEAIRIFREERGLGIGTRKMTVSTVGLIERIVELASAELKPNLAISLHAVTDELRDQLIPFPIKGSVEELVEAGTYYRETAKRDVTFEYVVIEGVNDHLEHADRLASLLRGLKVKVNLIPMNPIEDAPYRAPKSSHLQAFAKRIETNGVWVTTRKTRGDDIDAACGQLRARSLKAAESGDQA
jgi:23S rRNA (adenine2503-C2)-methyltransferase